MARFQPKKRNGAAAVAQSPALLTPPEPPAPVQASPSRPGVEAATISLVSGEAHAGVFGVTRSGKSSWLKAQLLKVPRFVVLDVEQEYWHGHGKGGPAREEMTCSELTEHWRKLLEPTLSLAVVPDDDTPKEAARAFNALAEMARLSRLPVVVVAEETGTYGQQCEEALRTLSTRGAKRQLQLVVVSQRPALVPKTVRSQLAQLVCFRTIEGGDIEALEERTRDQNMVALPQLADHYAVEWRSNPSATAQP